MKKIIALLSFSVMISCGEELLFFSFEPQELTTIKSKNECMYYLDTLRSFKISEGLFNQVDGSITKKFFEVNQNSEVENLLHEIDLSDGNDTEELRIWVNSKVNDKIFIYKINGEIWSYLYIFKYDSNKINYIGDIALGVLCSNCDSKNYPLNYIKVFREHGNTYIKFLKGLTYRGSLKLADNYHEVSVILDKLTINTDDFLVGKTH